MQKWEYLTAVYSIAQGIVVFINNKQAAKYYLFEKPEGKTLEQFLHQAGMQGWEAVSFVRYDSDLQFIFKRPVE